MSGTQTKWQLRSTRLLFSCIPIFLFNCFQFSVSQFMGSRLILLRFDGFSIMRYQLARPQPIYRRPINFGFRPQINLCLPCALAKYACVCVCVCVTRGYYDRHVLEISSTQVIRISASHLVTFQLKFWSNFLQCISSKIYPIFSPKMWNIKEHVKVKLGLWHSPCPVHRFITHQRLASWGALQL